MQKVVCALIYILLMILCIGIFNYIGLEISGDFNRKQYILLSVTPFISSLPLFAMNLFVSTFTHKTKKIFGLSLGIVFVSYFLQTVSEMNEVTEFFKYFTVYTLADIRNVILDTTINPIMIIISTFITISFIISALIRYEKKELV